MIDRIPPKQASELIDKMGGTTAVAEFCDIRAPSVSEWRNAGIPKPWARYFMALDEIERLERALSKCKLARNKKR